MVPDLLANKAADKGYLNYGHARLAFLLGESGYARLFPDAKPDERLTWSGFRKAAYQRLLRAQNDDGSWGERGDKIRTTALFLNILLLENRALPMTSR